TAWDHRLTAAIPLITVDEVDEGGPRLLPAEFSAIVWHGASPGPYHRHPVDVPVGIVADGGGGSKARRRIRRGSFLHGTRSGRERGLVENAAPPAGLEPAACCLEGSCSIQLSYGGQLLDRTQ